MLETFEKIPPFTREDIEEYAADLRESDALSEIERAYDDLIQLLRRDVLPRRTDHSA
jgi:hypothetical protein